MTVAEYRALKRWRRGIVRLTNHPIVANLLLPHRIHRPLSDAF